MMNIDNDLNGKFILCFLISLIIFACAHVTDSKVSASSVYIDTKSLDYPQSDEGRKVHYSLSVGVFEDELTASYRVAELSKAKFSVNQVKIFDALNQTSVLLYSGRYKNHNAASEAQQELAEFLQVETKIIRHPMSL